jgi:thiol-disulfide isomerase/thioredoxin
MRHVLTTLLLTLAATAGCLNSNQPGPPATTNQGSSASGTGEEQSQPNEEVAVSPANSGIRLEAVEFDEPAGISYAAGKLYIADTNNHRIRVVDLENNNQTGTLEIRGLAPPRVPPEPELPASAAETETQSEEPAVVNGQDETMPEVDETDPRKAAVRPPVPEEATDDDDLAAELDDGDPFAGAPTLPFDFPAGAEWLNTDQPLSMADLKGKFILIDFWTYCCINCIHILPELKKLERAFPNDLVVIGVHSAKFEKEKGTQNIEEAILRYEIEHPVVNDPEHEIWDMFGARSWPTIVLIDPQGRFLGKVGGEIQAEPFANLLKKSLPYFHEKGISDTTPLKFALLKDKQDPSPLRFPGKVLADEKSQRLFIADSNHNRIVVATLAGKLLDTIGTGAIGQQDGGYDRATFNKPQGMALHGETLYVADTENHLLRRIDLAAKSVATIAGTGEQGRNAWPGTSDEFHDFAPPPERFVTTAPREFAINSPWALWIHESDLYIAMAGPHQIWKMPLDESELGPYAGNGREDIVDGPLLPATPYARGASSFAQPSGLASDGEWLYVADSEGSSIRAVPFDPTQEVKTIVGTSHLEFSRLFEFGHRDGQGRDVLLQHPLGVVHHQGKLYITDTYNDAIKEIDLAERSCKTIAGTPPPPAELDAPAEPVDETPAVEPPATEPAATQPPAEEVPQAEPATP